MPDTAKPRFLALCDDLFDRAKIDGTARAVGSAGAFAPTVESLAGLAADEGAAPAGLLLVDLNLVQRDGAEGADLVRRIKADPRLAGVPMVAYLSHVQVDLRKAAEAAGADRVWPRSRFSAELADLLCTHCGGRLPDGAVRPGKKAAEG